LTFKDLRKRVSTLETTQESKALEPLHNKPFWIWNIEEHRREDIKTNGNCRFNHIIGLPIKGKAEKPIFDYQQIIFDSLDNNKHLWIKKATGLGVSEFMLRFMAWLCLKDNSLSGSQMCIVTVPRIELAIALIQRMKALFRQEGLVTFDTKETVIEINGVKIEAFPSHHLDAMRGISNVSFILLDEADFFHQDSSKMQETFQRGILLNQILILLWYQRLTLLKDSLKG
jgi:RAD3-like DEAD/DEAH box helicase